MNQVYLRYKDSNGVERFSCDGGPSMEEISALHAKAGHTDIEEISKDEYLKGVGYNPEDELKADIRAQRNLLLDSTQYLVSPDYSLTDEQYEEIKIYRQALRDVPQQEGFPQGVVWPERPSWVK